MVVRFQVDPDFYDHPKSIGLSDAATALWVRAGSYSAAKLLDGLVPEHVLSSLSRSSEEAAEELVARGLWRRSRQGFRFHQWDQRNLTRARVDSDREYERERKRRQRETASQNGKAQLGDGLVPAEVPAEVPAGHHPESRAGPGGSVSVSVSTSVSKKTSPSASPTASDHPEFARFWAAYPRKVGKPNGRKAWAKAIKGGADPAAIITAAERFAGQCARKRTETRFIPHPATWLNDERWADPRPATNISTSGATPWWEA